MDLLDYEQAAEFLGVRRGTLYAWVSLKRVPHIRFSARCVRFDRGELETWVERQRVAAQASGSGAGSER